MPKSVADFNTGRRTSAGSGSGTNDPISAFAPKKQTQTVTEKQKKKKKDELQAARLQRAEAVIGNMGSGVGGGMGIGVSGRRSQEIADLSDNISTLKQQLRSIKSQESRSKTTNSFLGESASAFAIPTAKQYREDQARREKERAQKAEQAQKRYEEEFPTKYANYDKKQTDAALKQLKQGGEKTAQEYEWLKADQYYHWTKEELKQGIKANEKRMAELEANMSNADAAERAKYGAEHKEAQNNDNAMRTALETMAYAEEFAKMPEDLADEIIDAAGEYQLRGAYTGAGEDVGGVNVGSEDRTNTGEEYREKMNKLTKELANRGYSKDQINGFFDYAVRAYNARKAKEQQEGFKESADVGGKKQAMSAASVVANTVGGGIGSLDLAMQRLTNGVDPFTGERRSIDFNSAAQRLANASREMRSARSEGMDSTASFLYNTGMSIADFMLASRFGNVGAQAILGSSAAQSAAQEAHMRGASDDQALLVGLTSGLAEAVFESISLEKLSALEKAVDVVRKGGTRLTAKEVAKAIGVQSFTEGSEEFFTTLANTLTDALIMGDKSELNSNIKRLVMDEGLSKDEATREAWTDWFKNLALDFAGGAISGGLIGSFEGGRVAGSQAMWNHRIGNAETATQNVNNLRAAMNMPRNSASRAVADKVIAKLAKGGIPTKSELGKLAYALDEDAKNGVEVGSTADSDYEISLGEDGKINVVMKLGPIAEELQASGMTAKDAIASGNALETLVSGGELSGKQIKKLAKEEAVRKAFTRMTGKTLPEGGKLTEMADAMESAAAEYRAEQDAIEQQRAEDEAALAEQGKELEEVQELYDEVSAEIEQNAQAQAAEEMNNAVTEAEHQQQTQAEQQTDAEPALTKEQYTEQYRREQREKRGFVTTPEQEEAAWNRYIEKDGIKLDNGEVIPRSRFFEEVREYYSNLAEDPIDLTDEQLDEYYMARRAASRAKPEAAAAWSNGAEAQTEQAESAVTESTASEPVGANNVQTEAVNGATISKNETVAPITEQNTERVVKKKNAAKAEQSSQPRQSVVNDDVDISDDELRSEGVESSPNVSREQLVTMLYLKPYLDRMGIKNVRFVGNEIGDAEASIDGDTIKINENHATTAGVIARVIGHEILHPATSQTRRERGDENNSLAEDVINLMKDFADKGLLHGVDGDKIKYQIEHFDETLKERTERYANYYRNEGYSEAEIAEKTAEHLMREEIAADWMGYALRNTNILEKLAGVKSNPLARVLDAIDRIRGMEINHLLKTDSREYRAAVKALEDVAEKTHTALANAEKEREASGEMEQTDSERHSVSSVYAAVGLNAKLEDGLVKVYDKNGNAVSKVTPQMVNDSSLGAMINLAATGIERRDKNGNNKFFSPPTISAADAREQIKAAAELLNMMLNAQDGALVWNFAGATLFSAVKTNSDGQYSITIDFSTVCRKTRNMMAAMSEAMVELGRGLTKEEVIDIQNRVVNEGGEVNCPVCYVFSRWAGIGGILENMKQFQEKYGREYDDDAKLDAAIKDLEQKLKNKKDLRAALIKYDTQYQDLTRDVENINDELKELRKRKREVSKTAKKDNSAANELAQIDAAINSKIKDRESAKKELKKLEADSTPELAWLKRVRAVQDEDGNWKSNPEYWHGGFVGTKDKSGKYTTDVKTLFNLEDAATFVEKYPLAWSYRTSRGPAAGKAILPYSDMVLGDFILGPKSGANTGNTDFADTTSGEFNKTQMGKIQSAIRRVLAQNLIGGQRFQSTSDFRFDYGLDYLMAFWELQAVGSTMQSYTKVPDFVHLAAAVGGDVNISMMPRDSGVDENGRLIYSDVTGVDPGEAFKLNELYDSAQLILVGINDQHIAAALEDNTDSGGAQIGFVIPYHASGASINEYISKLLQNLGEEFQTEYYKDYSKLQTDSEKKVPDSTDAQVKTWLDAMKRNPTSPDFGTDAPNAAQMAILERKLRSEIRTAILTGKTSFLNEDGTKGNANESNAKAFVEDALTLFEGKNKDISRMSFERLSEIERRALAGDPDAIKEYESWSAGVLWNVYQKMWVDENAYDTYDVRLTSQQAHAIMPHEYWNKKVNRDKAYVNGFIFRSYCHSLGLYPRFSGYTSTGQYLNYGDFTSTATGISEDAQKGYWKMLIDRPMYDNNGRYREQNRINATDVLKITEEGVLDVDLIGKKDATLNDNSSAHRAAQSFIRDNRKEETARYSVPSTGETELAIYIKDGKKADGTTVDFISAILDGTKKGETRTHKNLTRKWVGLAKDGKVYGRVRLGDPIPLKKGTQEYRDSLIAGTEYDIKPGEAKYYYPVLEVEDFRNNPVPILKNGNYGQYQRTNPADAFKPVAQKHTSRGTSINTKKLPKLYSSVEFEPGTVNIDIGAGVEDTPATKYLAEQGVESLPFDPFNRTKETNLKVTDFLKSGEKADTATCSNVLNVIDNADARANVILQMAKAIKPDGEAYFTVYSNKDNLDAGKAGEVKSKPDQWHEFRAAQTYIPEIEQYFDEVLPPKNGVIVARKPKKNLPAAMWQVASTEFRDKSGNRPYAEDEAVRFSIPVTPQQNEEYVSAVESGDMETAQRMVDEAAKAAGYDSPKLYHGTKAFGFTVFSDPKKVGYFFTDSVAVASTYSGKENETAVSKKVRKGKDGARRGNYAVYLKMEKPLTIDCQFHNWDDIPISAEESYRGKFYGLALNNEYTTGLYVYTTTDNVVEFAKENGYDGVIFENVRDNSSENPKYIPAYMGGKGQKLGANNVYAVLESEQIKSADPVTYDEDGNVIPLSERFNSEKNDIRYSLPGENDLFDQYIKKMEEDMRQKYLQEYPPTQRESQTNSTNPLLTDEEKAKTGREKGDIVHTVVTDEGMADMVAARLDNEENIAKEKRTLFRKGKKWTAADLAVAEELIKREVDRARETDDFDEAKRLLKMHDAQMSDWGLAGHTAREFSRTIASIINDATNIIDAAAEHQAVNKQKKKTGKQVEKGASEVGKEALGKIREEIGNAAGERPGTANAFKTKKENAQSKGGKNAVDSNMVNEPFTFEYADAVGTALANSIAKRGEQRQQAKTFLKQIQEEMMRFANERLPARKNKTKPTTATELLKSLVDNRKFFDKAWEAASDELRRKYGDNIPGGVQAFMRGWYGLSDGALSSNIMKAAIVSSAVATEETANLIRKQAAVGSRDIGKVIADDLISKTGASGELADMIRAAADAYVEDIVGKQEAGTTAKKRDYLINSALREIGKAIDAKAGPTSMGRLGSTSAASKAVVRDAVINTLMNKYAASEADAERVADTIGNRFDELLREGMKQRLESMFKEKEAVTPKKQKAFLDRLIELTNLGAMESEDYHDAAVSKLLDGYETRRGVSTDTVLREIYDYASKLDSVPKGDIKNLKKMVAELNAKRWTGGLFKGDEIHKTLQKAIDQVASEPGGEEFLRDLIAAQIRGIANDNSKITGVERASAIRYLSMLSKLTTVMRNLIGNTAFDLVDTVSQDVSVPLDILLSQFTKRRTTTVDKSLLSKAKREGMVAAATRAYIETALDAPIEDGTNRWEMRDGRTFKMAKREDANALQKVGNAVERYFSTMEKWQRYLLTVSDEFYKGGTREERQRQIDWLKSKGLLEEDALMDEAQQLALERTFQNNDLMAQLVDLPRRGLDLIGFKDYKGNRFGLGKAIMPFARVPANLVGQIFNYSPAGLAKGVAEAIIVAKNGKNATAEQQAKAVRDLGRGMNGTTLIGLLTIAAMRGLLSVAGAGSGDDDEKALERDMGKTGTQLNLSALQRWMKGESTDWQDGDVLMSVGGIEPLNGPMAFAGLLAASAESNSNIATRILNGNFQTAMQALSELPAMSTVNNIINAYKYSDEKYDEETNPNGGPWKQFADAAAQFGGDVASSFMPNIISGIAQGLDEGKVRTTQTSDKRGIEAVPEEVLNSFKMKTPGLRSTLPQALDSFGQERQTTAGTAQNWLNANILPLAINSFRPNEVSQELINLRKEGAKITMPPRNAPKTVGSEDDKKRLTESERREYQKTVGASELETMTDAIGNTDYQNASAATRAQVWANLKSYATAKGKQAVGVDAETPKWAGKYEGTIAGKAITAAYFTKAKKDAGLDSSPTNAELIEAVTSSDMSSSMQNVVLRDNLSEAGYKKYVGAKNVGLSAQAYVLLLGETSDDRMPADKDKNGKTISGSRKEKVVAYLRELQNYGLLNEEQVKYFIADVYGWKY